MNRFDELLQMIEDFLIGKYDPLEFSLDADYFLCQHYDDIEKVNKEVAIYLNDELPDICDIYERGDDPTELKKQIKAMYEKVKAML